jgi:murein DD-endopeptidase MepM/ murein hydrolase activator NlpD
MRLEGLMAGVGAAFLFATGVAAAALADSPPTTTETTSTATTTTSTTTTTTAATTTTTTSTSTSTTTTTVPAPTTTTTSMQTATETAPAASPSAPKSSAAPRRKSRLPRGAEGRTSVTGGTARENALDVERHKKQRKHRRLSRPLKVTPPLGQSDFVFPVVGPSGYGDTYGDFREDVRGKWHHGDDLFAPLGAPVVAVAGGTINRVGWKKLGGWRLWVRDSAGDEFYYAHLSGYTRSVFHSRNVRAGQVIGFVGDTGDAFGGAPHLHFEIHPRQLLRLRYGGAVNPTTYLDSWPHLESVDAPFPVLPRLPKQPRFRSQARQVFRELLAVRDLISKPWEPRHDLVPAGLNGSSSAQQLPLRRIAQAAGPREESSTLAAPVLLGVASLALFAAAILLAALRRLGPRRNAKNDPASSGESS